MDSDGAAEVAPPPRPPVCSVGFVMVTFTACLVLIVATICFSITYTTTINQLRSIGRDYAESIVGATSTSISDYFDYASTPFTGVSRTFRREGMELPAPKDDPTHYTTLRRVGRALLPSFAAAKRSVVRALVIFGDGSTVMLSWTEATASQASTLGMFYINNALAVNRSSGLGPYEAEAFDDPSTMNRVPFIPFHDLRTVNATHGYSQVSGTNRALAQDIDTPILNNYGFFLRITLVETATYAVAAGFPFRNASHMIGVGYFHLRADALDTFLAAARSTRHSQIVAVDMQGTITASTHPAPYRTARNITGVEAATIPDDAFSPCWSSGEYLGPLIDPNKTYTYTCRAEAKDYPYPPLQASIDDMFLYSKESNYSRYALSDTARFAVITVAGSTYYVAASAVQTHFTPQQVPAGFFIMLFMPEEDILGDIAATRTACIAATATIFFIASGVAAGGIFMMLRPIRRMAARMKADALLGGSRGDVDDDEDDGVMSRYMTITEVVQLKSAFDKMREAMDSFERYVPRTVVKELIGAGNLCHIAMEHRACTMMFTEIARFGDMCDAVAADQLAPLLQQYFARVSAMVAEHDGVVDKFIGDTIMIVWGAPRETENRETKAVLCGLLVARAAKQAPLRESFRAIGQSLRIRVGVASGLVLAGNMGSSERMSYSVIGDAVSTASRLLELCRAFSMRVLIDHVTAEACKGTFCMHRVVPTSFSRAPYNVLGLLDVDAANNSAAQNLVLEGEILRTTEILDTACAAYLEDRLDDAISLVESLDDETDAHSGFRMLLREVAETRLRLLCAG